MFVLVCGRREDTFLEQLTGGVQKKPLVHTWCEDALVYKTELPDYLRVANCPHEAEPVNSQVAL